MIVRRLLGLEHALSMGICGPEHDWRSWTFDLDPGGVDPVLGIHWLREAFEKAVPGYDRGVTVPAVVEVAEGAVVTADYRQITLDMEHEWTAFHRPGAPELYPEGGTTRSRRSAPGSTRTSTTACTGAGSRARRRPTRRPTASCSPGSTLSERPATRRYLAGDTITEADVRLWPTLVRFDAVYHGHFKCNRSKITEMPVLWAYARDLYQTPGFGDTIDFAQTKAHYYRVHTNLNPSRIVPAGPDLSGWPPRTTGGTRRRPFGDGTPPARRRPRSG